MTAFVVLLALAAAHVVAADDDAPLPEVAAALAQIRDASTIELTTTGRKTGKEHARPIWFVVSDGKIIVQAGKDGKTDWYQNLRKTPVVAVRHDEYTFRARATRVADPARIERIHQIFRDKYPSARMLSWLGSSIGQGAPVEVAPISVAAGGR